MNSGYIRVGLLALCVACVVSTGCTSARTAQLRERFADFGGERVHYLDVGEGDNTLVCIHGWASDTTVWRDQIPVFRDRMRMLVIDLPGHGRSDQPADGYSMDVFARSIAAVMDDAGVSKAVLMGHSNGVPVVRQFWRKYPERTVALVLVEGALLQVMPPEAAQPFLDQFRGPEFKQAASRMVDQLSGIDDELRERVRKLMMGTAQSALVGGMEASLDPAIWTDDPIGVPTLCLLAKSPFWSADYEKYVRKLIPGVDYRVLDGVSHFVMMEVPERFNPIVERFLGDHDLLGE